MTLLVIENYPNAGLAAFGRIAARKGYSWETVRAFASEELPRDISPYSGLVVLGGVQNALADNDYPHLPIVCDLIRIFHQAGRPVLGICLGCQLIARAFGGENILGRRIEFGWHQVTPTEAGSRDPVLKFLGNGAPAFHWHTDTVTLPEGAVRLAESAKTPVQAFRLGRATYAIQFHFEAAEADVRDWSRDFADEILVHAPDWSQRLDAEAGRHADKADALGRELAEAWLALL